MNTNRHDRVRGFRRFTGHLFFLALLANFEVEGNKLHNVAVNRTMINCLTAPFVRVSLYLLLFLM